MKRIVMLMLTLVVTVGVGRIATAEEGGKKKGGGFAALDTNGDGKLSEEEFIANKPDKEKAKKRFAKIDANGDGSITKEEMKAAHQNKEGGGKKKKD